MIFNEIFFKNNQPANDMLHVRQAGELLEDINYSVSRSNSQTNIIGYIKSGCMFVEYQSKSYSVNSGQSFFLPGGISYSLRANKQNPPNFLWVNLRGKLLVGIADIVFDGECCFSNCNLEDYTDEIRKLIKSENDQYTEISAVVLKMILGISQKKVSVTAEEKVHLQYEHYISNCIQSEFSVADMAKHFHCSVDTINRQFQKIYQKTPYQYYQNMRIEISKTMLCNTKLTIEDISERLHFSDRNHFSQCFKKATGFTPIQFRKENNRLSKN